MSAHIRAELLTAGTTIIEQAPRKKTFHKVAAAEIKGHHVHVTFEKSNRIACYMAESQVEVMAD